MQVNFSTISENLALTYGDAQCMVNVERNRRYSFREYHLLTNQIVNMMRDRLGIGKDDVVLTILNNDSASLLSFFTACKGEAVFCYTNVVDSLADQARQLDLVQPKVVFIESELLATHYSLLDERGVTVVSMDPPGREFSRVLDFWGLVGNASAANPDVIRDDRDDCVVLRFTGGTTGAPKAVMYSIDNWMASKDSQFSMPDPVIHRDTRFLHYGLISHGSGVMLFPVMFRGGCNLTTNNRDLIDFCAVVQREKITGTTMMPPLLYRFLETGEVDDFDLGSLEVIFYGGLPIVPARLPQLQKRFGNIFLQFYAASESCAMSTVLGLRDHFPLADGSISHFSSTGKICPGNEIQIRDAEGLPMAIGCYGEIWHKSRAVSRGYWKDPEKTAKEFSQGYWKSGDVGRIDGNGYLYVIDRIKDTFVSGGHTIYPSSIEAAICAHPEVKLAAVVGVPDVGAGEAVHAEVVLTDTATLGKLQLVERLREALDSHCVPTSIEFVKEIPLSPVGKALRRQVRDNYLKRIDDSSSSDRAEGVSHTPRS
jgi:acyl-CoA synthetase (AMP-forming)/AMP-acid ligase II